MRLLEAALVEREMGIDSWRDGMRRVGEVLEWLSHPELNPHRLPIRLLAAAAYQLAGYPARSTGLLTDYEAEGSESQILRALLRADLPKLFRLLGDHWADTEQSMPPKVGITLPWDDTEALAIKLHQWIVTETTRALGVLCTAMRWGSEPRLEKALDKLSAIGKVLLSGDDPYSWLLAKLCAEVARVYVAGSMRYHLSELLEGVSAVGALALERYLRQSYQYCRALAWPSQVRGIERLVTK